MNKQLYYKQFSYIDSLNTTESKLKINQSTKTNNKYRRNIREIENIYHLNDWKPIRRFYPLFSNIPLLSSNKVNLDYTLMKQKRKKPKYLNKKYTKIYNNNNKNNNIEKYNLNRKTMKDNWRYIIFLYKNKNYLKKNLFCKIADNFMNIIDDNKKLWIGASYSPNKVFNNNNKIFNKNNKIFNNKFM